MVLRSRSFDVQRDERGSIRPTGFWFWQTINAFVGLTGVRIWSFIGGAIYVPEQNTRSGLVASRFRNGRDLGAILRTGLSHADSQLNCTLLMNRIIEDCVRDVLLMNGMPVKCR
jgi:hypothetical protein